ncbi:MAG TPA: bifunctional diguanylate cyclase/phosphodiesterase [Mycobacteriales bacterium]|nr:bifunctional diguanylate cyclase/phosphodiesterase [Mycobacteriales bacterium]
MTRLPAPHARYSRDLVLAGLVVTGAAVAAELSAEPAPTHLALAAVGLVAALAALTVVRRPDAERRVPWALLAVSGIAWTAGELAYGVQLLADAPARTPSVADAGHLAAAALLVAALLGMAGARRGLTAVLGAVLDGLLIAGSLMVVAWVTVVGPAYRADDAEGISELAIVVYPVAALLTGTVAMYAVLAGRRGRRVSLPALVLVSGGALLLAISDSSWASLLAVDITEPTGIVTAGWYAGWLVLYAAARHPSADAGTAPAAGGDARPLTVGTMLPFLALLVAAGVGVVDAVLRGEPSAVVAAIGAGLLVVCTARLAVFVVETARFAHDLESRVVARTAEIQVREERFRALVARSSDVVTVLRPDGVIAYQSSSVTRVLGRGPEELVGHTVASLLHEQDQSRFHALVDRVRGEPDSEVVAELRMTHRDGGYRITETTIANLLRERSVRGIVLNSRDITDRRQLERALEHQTLHDPLTGLANRSLFRDSVSHALSGLGRRPRVLAVVHVDLDGFGHINEEQGNEHGDDVLRGIARMLRVGLRDHDVVARVGGDEFGLLLDDVVSRDALAVTVDRMVAALADGVEIAGSRVPVRATAGVAIADTADTADALLRNAELALHRAKADGRGFSFYDTVMHATVDVRRSIEEDLRAAVSRSELVLHYQPTVELATGRIVGVEALVQWAHPTRGLLAPMTFIPLAEETGVILEIGGWVLEEACRQAADWQRRFDAPGDLPLQMYVNVSGRQLQEPEFARMVAWQVNSSEIHPHSLVLEMSEGILVEGADVTRHMLLALKAMGVRLAIEDFGTGYTSLSYLERLPVDVLKIDRSFVELLTGTEMNEEVERAHTVVQVGHTLGLQMVAEGVETREQLRALLAGGCEHGQGFLFHRPVPAGDLERALATQFALGAAGEPVFS